ncbi:10068_t:CDS:2 [Paraglomus occultum]|uniref:10068_t:CDS:1 n=1 Tax=Paraglomus occultum TaxID=144539 RepID=A0A9N9CHJ9_9GLOM|nr:10068_t:CDS:2 [Paraglomus occultum]
MLKLERKHFELSRWSEDTEEYKNAAKLYFEHKKKEQLSIVQSWASEYKYYKYLLTKSGHRYFFEADYDDDDCWIWQHFDGLQTAGNVQSSTQLELSALKINLIGLSRN